MLEEFHFLRPLWLLALPVAGGIVFALLRAGDARHAWRDVIDPHLLDALLIRGESRRGPGPTHLLAVVWLLGILGMAGPAWRREPAPFAEDSAVLVIVVKAAASMLATDVQPSRLERGTHKVSELLKLRPDVDYALFAYAGSAHRTMPLTGDANVIEYFTGALSPDIMPLPATGPGTDSAADAIAQANEELRRAGRSGSIVLVSDGVEQDQAELIAASDSVPVHVLAMVAPGIDTGALARVADATGGSLQVVTADGTDVERLARNARSAIGSVSGEDAASYSDEGYWLLPLLALLLLAWSRRGWAVAAAGGRR